MNKSFNLKQFKDSVFKLLDEYSRNGEPIRLSDGYAKDLGNRFPLYASMALKAVFEDIPKKCSVEADLIPSEPFITFKNPEEAPFIKISETDVYHVYVKSSGNFIINAHNSAEMMPVLYLGGSNSTLTEEHSFCLGELRKDSDILFSESGIEAIEEISIYRGGVFSSLKKPCAPPDGKAFAILPQNITRITDIRDRNGKTVSDGSFKWSDELHLITSDVSLCGKYFIDCLEDAPEFKDEARDTDTVSLPADYYRPVILKCASLLCPTENEELFSRLSDEYTEVRSALRKKYCEKAKIQNTFFVSDGSIGRAALKTRGGF